MFTEYIILYVCEVFNYKNADYTGSEVRWGRADRTAAEFAPDAGAEPLVDDLRREHVCYRAKCENRKLQRIHLPLG